MSEQALPDTQKQASSPIDSGKLWQQMPQRLAANLALWTLMSSTGVGAFKALRHGLASRPQGSSLGGLTKRMLSSGWLPTPSSEDLDTAASGMLSPDYIDILPEKAPEEEEELGAQSKLAWDPMASAAGAIESVGDVIGTAGEYGSAAADATEWIKNIGMAGWTRDNWLGNNAQTLYEHPPYMAGLLGTGALGVLGGYRLADYMERAIREGKAERDLDDAKAQYEAVLREPVNSKTGEVIEEQYNLWKQGEAVTIPAPQPNIPTPTASGPDALHPSKAWANHLVTASLLGALLSGAGGSCNWVGQRP